MSLEPLVRAIAAHLVMECKKCHGAGVVYTAYLAKGDMFPAECAVPVIEADLMSRLNAENWGLKFDLIKITDFAFVKTYRFITNESNTNFWSGSIDLGETAQPTSY